MKNISFHECISSLDFLNILFLKIDNYITFIEIVHTPHMCVNEWNASFDIENNLCILKIYGVKEKININSDSPFK